MCIRDRLQPNCQLLGATTVGANAQIGPDCTMESCEIGEGATVRRSEAHHSVVGAGAAVGPFSYLRPGTVLGAKGKIGAFVETKNARIGAGAKVPHLTYCGDAESGAGANIGAGTIFANYDGIEKHPTYVGEHSFVGSHTVLVAPVSVADGAYVAAGSTIVDPVPPGQLGLARARHVNLDGWVERRRGGTSTATAAQAAQERDQ